MTARFCGAGASPPLRALKVRVLEENSRRPPAGLTVIENDLVVVALRLSVARMTNENAPAASGVPVKAPVAGSSKRPSGGFPESRVQVRGGYPPVAAKVSA